MKGKNILVLGILITFLFTSGFGIKSYAGGLNTATYIKSMPTATPTVSVETVSAAPGSSVEVAISISDNPGILGATLTLSYDEGLTLTSAKAGEAFGMLAMTEPGEFTSPCNFVWDGQKIADEDIKNGVILTLTFKVSDSAQVGEILNVGMTCAPNGIVDGNLDPVHPQMVAGGVSIKSAGSNMPTISVTGTSATSGSVILELTSSNTYSDIHILVAAYSPAGQMYGCDMQTVAIPEGISIYSFEKKYGNALYKAFVLNEEFCPCIPAVPLQ